MLSLGIPNGASSVLLFFLSENIFDHGNPIESNQYKNEEVNKTVIFIIAIYGTYLLNWCTTIPNDHPGPLLIWC